MKANRGSLAASAEVDYWARPESECFEGAENEVTALHTPLLTLRIK